MNVLSFVIVGVIFGVALALQECWDQAKLKEYIPAFTKCGLKKEDAENLRKVFNVFVCLAKKENLFEGRNIVIKKMVEYQVWFALEDMKDDIEALIKNCSDGKESVELVEFVSCYQEDLDNLCKKDLSFLN